MCQDSGFPVPPRWMVWCHGGSRWNLWFSFGCSRFWVGSVDLPLVFEGLELEMLIFHRFSYGSASSDACAVLAGFTSGASLTRMEEGWGRQLVPSAHVRSCQEPAVACTLYSFLAVRRSFRAVCKIPSMGYLSSNLVIFIGLKLLVILESMLWTRSDNILYALIGTASVSNAILSWNFSCQMQCSREILIGSLTQQLNHVNLKEPLSFFLLRKH